MVTLVEEAEGGDPKVPALTGFHVSGPGFDAGVFHVRGDPTHSRFDSSILKEFAATEDEYGYSVDVGGGRVRPWQAMNR
jgi:hypothetical protein